MKKILFVPGFVFLLLAGVSPSCILDNECDDATGAVAGFHITATERQELTGFIKQSSNRYLRKFGLYGLCQGSLITMDISWVTTGQSSKTQEHPYVYAYINGEAPGTRYNISVKKFHNRILRTVSEAYMAESSEVIIEVFLTSGADGPIELRMEDLESLNVTISYFNK